MKKLIIAMIVVLGLASVAGADIILQYAFTGSTMAPTTADPRITGSLFNNSQGNFAYGTSTASTATGGPDAPSVGTSNWTTTQNNYWTFTLNLNNQTLLNAPQALSLSFTYRCSGTGPTVYNWQYNDNGAGWVSLGTGSLLANSAWQSTVTTSASALAGATGTIAFRLYGTGTTATAGTWNIDSVTLTGSMIPEPTTLALLGLGAAGLFIARRRMRK